MPEGLRYIPDEAKDFKAKKPTEKPKKFHLELIQGGNQPKTAPTTPEDPRRDDLLWKNRIEDVKKGRIQVSDATPTTPKEYFADLRTRIEKEKHVKAVEAAHKRHDAVTAYDQGLWKRAIAQAHETARIQEESENKEWDEAITNAHARESLKAFEAGAAVDAQIKFSKKKHSREGQADEQDHIPDAQTNIGWGDITAREAKVTAQMPNAERKQFSSDTAVLRRTTQQNRDALNQSMEEDTDIDFDGPAPSNAEPGSLTGEDLKKQAQEVAKAVNFIQQKEEPPSLQKPLSTFERLKNRLRSFIG